MKNVAHINITIAVLLCVVQRIETALFQVTSLSSSISSNFTLVDNVNYDLNFSLASESITAGSTVGIKFSQHFLITMSTLTNCMATTNSAAAPVTVPCSVIYYSGSQIYEITMTSIFTLSTTYTFLRLNFRISNPYAEVSQPLNLTIYNPSSTMVGYGTAYISNYKASVIAGCSIQSASMLTGANATHTYTFTPPQRLLVNSYVLIDMPPWSGTTGNEATSSLICTGLQGTDSTSLSCGIQNPLTTQTLNITNGLVSANRSTSTIKISIADLRNPWSVEPFGPINIQLMYGTYLTQACYNNYNTVTMPNALSLFNFTISNLNISTTNTGVRLIFVNVNPFPKPSNRVMMEYPAELTVSYTGTIYSQSSTQITLAGVMLNSISGFSAVTPPSTRSYTLKCTTYFVNNGSPYAIQTKTLTLQNVAGAITAGTVLPTVTAVNNITSYQISFTIKNKLTTGSFIAIVFPVELAIQTGTATCSMAGHTCTVATSQNLTVTIASTIVAGSALSVTVSKVKNANEALTTSSFSIYTYYDSLYDSLVDRVITGITTTMTPSAITTGSVTPSSYTTNAVGFYKIDVTLLDPIPAGGFIVVIFPTTVVPQSAQLVAASYAISSCSSNLASNTINVTGCFSATMSALSLSLNFSNILNPISFKPSGTFKLYTRGPNGNLINSIESGLTVTMNIATDTQAFSVSPISLTVGTSTTYNFQITHAISSHSINDYVVIDFPALMTLPASPSCTAISGASISCGNVSPTQLKVVYTSVPSATVHFSLGSVTNYLVGDQAINYASRIYDSGDFQMEQFLLSPVTYSQSTITTVTVNNDRNIALGELSNITLTVSNAITLYASLTVSLTQLDVTIPPEFTIGSSCSSTSGSCAVQGLTKYRITGAGLSLSNLNVVMTNVLINYYNPVSTSFALVYAYNGFNVSVKTSGIVVGIFCTSPCRRCSTTVTTCESCMPAPNTLILHDPVAKTCAASCVAGKYPDANNVCQPCISPCSTCLDAVNCTACVPSMWLYQTTCMAVCPNTYFNNSNGLCASCQSPCFLCRSLSSCINCSTGFLSNNWCVAANSCPAGTYANTTTMTCEACTAPCSTCSLTATNCTACQTGYLYYSNLCVTSCPPGMYQSSIYCFSCVSPCSTCTSSTFCTACISLYLNAATGTCVNATNCPSGSYGNSTTMSCVPCQSPCLACSLSASTCTSCQPGYLYYSNLCVTSCPPGMYQSSNNCFSCVSPCSTCTSSTFCTACTTLYLNAATGTCVNATNCPSGSYGNSTSMTCAPCQSPCFSCSLSALTCTSCQSGYLYYSNLCVSSCPSGMYQSSTNCFNCVAPCSNCTSSSFCTSCASDYLNSATGQCVDSTSCPGGTYANDTTMQCRTCPTGCTGCTNSTNCTSCNSPLFLFYNFGCFASCPAGTYQSGITCLACTAPCLTCRLTDTTCLSCVAPKLFYQGACVDVCPAGTYNLSGACTTCMASCTTCSSGGTCDSCSTPLFYQGSQCVAQCSAGSFGNSVTSTCVSCVAPCSECSGSGSYCTKCISPQLQYQNGCVNFCPATYFPLSGSCITCPNCMNCLDATTCLQCKPGYYAYSGYCYTACPTTAPIADDATSTCGKCDASCFTCENTAKNCTSCFSGTYLYKGTCLTKCPLGFIEQPVSGTCKQPLIGKIIYFPFTFMFCFFLIVCIASKCFYPATESITILGGLLSICEFASWCLFTYIVTVDYALEAQIITAIKFVGLASVLLSIGIGVGYIFATWKLFQFDKGLAAWKQYEKSSLYSYRIVNALSCLTFRAFRILYSRFFNRTFLSMYIADGERFLTHSSRLTFLSLAINTLPMLGICAITIYKKQLYDQTFFCALDTLILGFLTGVFLTIDSCKNKDHFETMKDGLPFLKYKNMGNEESMISEALLSRHIQERDPAKSEVDQKQKDKIFQKITWLPNLNKYGHLNVLQNQNDEKDEVKSLPDHNKLDQYSQYDPNQNEDDRVVDDELRVVDDQLYFMQKEDELKKQQEQRIRQQQQQQQQQEKRKKQKQRRLEQQQKIRKQQEEKRRRKQLMQEDERQRIDMEFPDLAAIDKIENKNGKNRKNPLDLLSNCKKADEKPVDDKALKKLEEIGRKNGVDPTFMKQTFGIEKNHNPDLLNQIIDKHNHVKRESVKQLFNQKNNPEVLQQLFSKNSKMDPKKLREILNDPDSARLIEKLASKQNGIVSPEICKQLFQQNGKYTKEFTKNLLSDDNGMDPEKLKILLKDSNAKGKDSPLKALKKIGGQNLQNTALLNNMMGEDAVLKPEQFTRVANDLSIKAIENLFANKSKNSDIIASKLLNNKKINLKNLTPILEDQQLLQQLAQALGSGDPNLQENLINLFKNAENIDPAKLKQMLADPVIRQKLLTKSVDPSFLQNILSQDSKSDLKILSNALAQMPQQLIEQTFKFDPERNTDFKNLAQLFDANPKTDPGLVAKMLDPDMVKKLYVKGNDTKMLNKLVQKGNQFDPQVIKNVYGDQRSNIFDAKTDNFNEGNNMNILNFDDEKQGDFRSQKEYSLGFQKNLNKNEINMSRTAGGVLSFLTPIIPVNGSKNIIGKGSKMFNETNQDGWTSEGNNQQYLDDGQIEQEEDEVEENGQVKRRKKKGKKPKKKVTDIRHPAEEIYLQRIDAPHEVAMRKASIRKKKKKAVNPAVMDEDNDIFDMDF